MFWLRVSLAFSSSFTKMPPRNVLLKEMMALRDLVRDDDILVLQYTLEERER